MAKKKVKDEGLKDVFDAMYMGEAQLGWGGGMYLTDGIYVYPDGSLGDEDGPFDDFDEEEDFEDDEELEDNDSDTDTN